MATTERDNEELVGRVETVVNDQNNEILPEIFHDDVVVRFHGGREEIHGLDEFDDYLTETYEGFPDLTIDFEDVVSEDDAVVVRYTGSGTHEGEFRGLEPTGETVEVSGMRMVRVEDGKIAEVWGQRDDLGVLTQVGAVEPLET